MSPSTFKRLLQLLCLSASVSTAFASDLAGGKLRPSDCRPRDADSTCATAVAGAGALPPDLRPDSVLFDGPLGGVPATGYAYWGFDFVADQTGMPSLVRQDEFVNRSGVPVTITLSFHIPTDHPCTKDCLPGMQFQADAGWNKIDPPFVVKGDRVSLSSTFRPGQGYGWVIALWQSSDPRLTVTVPTNSNATLKSVGQAALPSVATEIPLTVSQCDCGFGITGRCSSGSHFSNGLLGAWFQSLDFYQRAGAFTECVGDH